MKYLYLLALLTLTACSGGEPAGTTPASVDAHKGRWVVVNYWAIWCKPCAEEIPELNALDEGYAEVTVLGVNFDGAEGEELAAAEQKLGIDFTTLPADPAPQLGTNRPVVLPTTLIINPEGELVDTLIGPQTLESLAGAIGLDSH